MRVLRGDGSAVQFDGAAGDGQAETDAPGGPVAVGLDAVERVEKAGESGGRDPWTLVRDDDADAAGV
jgi:hypothetical protein